MKKNSRTNYLATVALGLLSLACGCNSVKHVPEGSYLLDKVNVRIVDTIASGRVNKETLVPYLRQLPNHKLLWKAKFRLGIYNLSGRDSTRWYNKLARNLGEAPVIYDSLLASQSTSQLKNALINWGYLHARVQPDTSLNTSKRKASITYNIIPGPLYTISSLTYNIPDSSLRQQILPATTRFPLAAGQPLNLNTLDLERSAITDRLRNHGYYAFSRDFVSFTADTSANSTDVDLTVNVLPTTSIIPLDSTFRANLPWRVRKVNVITDFDPSRDPATYALIPHDTVGYKGLDIIYSKNHYLRPSIIADNCYIRSGELWSASRVNRTYEAFSRFGILKFINIRSIPVEASIDSMQWVDVNIYLTPGKSQTLSLELEGTNSEGDLGIAASIGYSHRNIARGSETLTAKFRGAYESLSGNLEGFIHNRYMEYSAEAGISFPRFKFPFLTDSFKRRIRASTEFNASLNYQERPEYTRVVANIGWSYAWTRRSARSRHVFTLVDVDYVYLPESTINFIDDIAPNNPLLRYSYEDHFIMRLGYSFYHTNKRNAYKTHINYVEQPLIYTIRAKAEIAGNLLFLINSVFTHRSNFHADPYKIFGIHYAQYFKAEGDYTLVHALDTRNTLAFRAGLGLIIPYGNSSVAPFEKRFYGGGANGVRGWDVRTLGPGKFSGSNRVTDFINQCGDINLILSAEYRSKLFWVVELGAFIDAGNIWTIHQYENQPGGEFHFNSFYKELAASYGLGIRMDFNYFLLRFDLGIKAVNPAEGACRWAIVHPRWGRDTSFHFSIGYPF